MFKTLKKSAGLSLACAVAAGAVFFSLPASAQSPEGKEKCYGVAKAGEDDGTEAMGMVPGMSTQDFQGDAFKFVTTGTCTATITPFGAGDLKPIANRPPQN